MDPQDLIRKKKSGNSLSDSEIKFLVQEYTTDNIPDYQMSAFLMAVWFNGLNKRERSTLTETMVETGQELSLPSFSSKLVDKHSTGGVGDGVSLSLVPLVASCGVKIPMISGRGLGHTGGTLDKLESIPGLSIEHDPGEVNKALKEVGAVIMGASDNVATADKKLYALRDVTSTIDSIDLIASSIMSKKLAENTNSLILDVKTGSGAFMESFNDAVQLGRSMVEIGEHLGTKVVAYITDMDQPLGKAVGNSIEMKQHIEILKGEGPDDLTKLICILGSEMLKMAGIETDYDRAFKKLQEHINNGKALRKLREMIQWQSGNSQVIDDYDKFPHHRSETVVQAPEEGYLQSINGFKVGIAAKLLGAGRETKESNIDYSAGIMVQSKVGDYVHKGDILYRLFFGDEKKEAEVRERLSDSYRISSEKPDKRPLVFGRIDSSGDLEELNFMRSSQT